MGRKIIIKKTFHKKMGWFHIKMGERKAESDTCGTKDTKSHQTTRYSVLGKRNTKNSFVPGKGVGQPIISYKEIKAIKYCNI